MLKIQDNDKTYFNKIHSFLKNQNIKLHSLYRHFEVIFMHKTLSTWEMKKRNRKLSFTKNCWASLLSRVRPKTSKCSISLAWGAECSKTKVTPLLFYTIICLPKIFSVSFIEVMVSIFLFTCRLLLLYSFSQEILICWFNSKTPKVEYEI